MEPIEFNLLEEPWIRVMTEDCTVRECSLTQVLLESHCYQRLAGELPTQDVAILRLLLAVLHTVFYRVDPEGEENPIQDPYTACKRWSALWQAGRLPEKPILAYLEEWKERFWLFHPEHPFYQVPGASEGTEYKAPKLNGELSESNNKIRLFPNRTGEEKMKLSYAEGARWLIYTNGFDDTSAKPKGKGLPSPGAGWMGKLGLIYAEGKNLFETLLLNLVLLEDGKELWEAPQPVWEREKPKEGERTEIVMPNNQAELLTLQSRRLALERKEKSVIGYSLLGGDFFSKINATAEQMTMWERKSGKKTEPPYDQPKRMNPERQMWRDFSIINGTETKERIPGVVNWIMVLKRRNLLDRNRLIRFRMAGVKYGDKDFFVEDILTDHLDFYADFLDEAGKLWANLVQKEIGRIERTAGLMSKLAEKIFKAEGGVEPKQTEECRHRAAQEYYSVADIPFRKWLCSIDPAQGDGEYLRIEKDEQWRAEGYQIARRQGERMVREAGEAAFVGRQTEGKIFSSVTAFQSFSREIRKCWDIKKTEKEASNE